MIEAEVGDKVMIVSYLGFRSSRRTIKVLTVEKKTKTQLRCSDGERYMIDSGYKVGTGESRRSGYYGYERLEDHDPKIEKDIKLEMAFYKKKDELGELIEKLSSAQRKLVYNADKPVFVLSAAVEGVEKALFHLTEAEKQGGVR